ncbi:MAG: hypothetical protein ACRD92_02590 [Nitrosopumilaceae archaeon]
MDKKKLVIIIMTVVASIVIPVMIFSYIDKSDFLDQCIEGRNPDGSCAEPPSLSKNTDDISYYPEELTLTWPDEKIIQDSDVITYGELVSYENNQWSVNTFYLTAKGDVKEPIIKVQTIFSEIYLADGTVIKPEVNHSYVWFLKQDGNEYRLAGDNGIVDSKYFHSIREAIAKPTVLNSIENKKVNLFESTVPRTRDGLIDYHELIKQVSKPVFVDLFAERGITVEQDDIVLMMGPWPAIYTEYSSMCGYTLVDDKVYWLQSDLKKDTLTKASIMTENPDPCRPSFGSCFCEAQYNMTENTVSELSYFDKSQEAYVGQTFQDYLNEGYKVVNVPRRFVVGDHNFEMKPDETTLCGAFVSEQLRNFGPDRVIRDGVVAYRYFSGVIKNDKVISFGLEEPMKLCAINPDAKVYDFK